MEYLDPSVVRLGWRNAGRRKREREKEREKDGKRERERENSQDEEKRREGEPVGRTWYRNVGARTLSMATTERESLET